MNFQCHRDVLVNVMTSVSRETVIVAQTVMIQGNVDLVYLMVMIQWTVRSMTIAVM